MEGLIGILILGFCLWMLIRHPLKTLSFFFKFGVLVILGIGAVIVLFWFDLHEIFCWRSLLLAAPQLNPLINQMVTGLGYSMVKIWITGKLSLPANHWV